MSWIEVECKIKVGDVNGVRKRIKSVARFVGREKKVDDYYALVKKGRPRKSLRVRDMGRKREVNFKQWIDYVDGIHAKKEVEFEVSDLGNFFDLLDDFGFRKWIRKEKKTELYRTKDGVNVELNYVKNLGWFIEIEILCKKREVNNARKKIGELRGALGFSAKDCEKNGYTKALLAKKGKNEN